MQKAEKNMSFETDKESHHKALEEAGKRKVALIHHMKIKDPKGHAKWLSESKGGFNSKRLFRVKADTVAREGMLIDEIVIDEFPSIQKALDFMSAFAEASNRAFSEYTVLTIIPEPSITFYIVKFVSWFIRLFKGVNDIGIPSATWKAENTDVWPDESQMDVARAQDLNEPLFVYNLNKYRPVAQYKNFNERKKMVTGKEAYNRYSKIAGFELLRRGAYPVYGGKPICILCHSKNCMLADRWDHFIFVRYPQRRNLLATIESDEFHKGEAHRDAGLERVAIFMTKKV